MVAHFEGWQCAGVLGQSLCSFQVAMAECIFALAECVLPGGVREIFSGQHWYEVFDLATEYALGWR
jgi:hypothetical protein